jgi:hypothetical protein
LFVGCYSPTVYCQCILYGEINFSTPLDILGLRHEKCECLKGHVNFCNKTLYYKHMDCVSLPQFFVEVNQPFLFDETFINIRGYGQRHIKLYYISLI